ncbi:MAG TPA: formimidoylglutamate deiminase, partial [Acidimicrobiales bacterium]|nr:formimidoylglutamate deiminase [Acidimicrobiales bacterium]
MPLWWAERAWLGGAGTDRGVLLDVKEHRLASVTPGLDTPPPGAERLPGVTLPGLANAHSHAFHRALRGRTHERPGSFWTWRDLMYEVASRLDPDGYRRLARAVYAEMALAGFTAVGEFHYLHRGPGGIAYSDPNQMGLAVVEAAADAGIRLTLLDALYLYGGFDAPLAGPQLRFGDADATAWAERVSRLEDGPQLRIGAAVHSVRAVDARAIEVAAAWATARDAPLHAHASEQAVEHRECLERLGRTPLGVLGEAGAAGPRFTAVHGNHFSPADISLLVSTGGTCCACPTTERDLGDGTGPFHAIHSAGGALSVGTDSHAVIDGFEEARALEMDSRSASEQRGRFTPDALAAALTAGGMAALGWEAGALAPGRLADFVTVRMDGVSTAGVDLDLIAGVLFAASAASVDTVVVG